MKIKALLLCFLIITLCGKASILVTGFGSGDFSVDVPFGESDSQTATDYFLTGTDIGGFLLGSISGVDLGGEPVLITLSGTLSGVNPNSDFQIGLYDADFDGLLYNGNWASFSSGEYGSVFLAFSGYDFQGTGSFDGVVSTVALSTNGAGSTIAFTADSISAIPEPATWAVMLGGTALFMVVGRRRRRTAA